MSLVKRVIIIGDGSAGIITANKLRFHTTEKDLEIVLIGNSPKHFYKPDGVLIPFGYKNYKSSVKPVEFLLNYGITYMKEEVAKINAEEGIVYLKSGKSMIGNYIVIATGDRYSPEDIPGYDGEAKHFFDLQRALELREHLRSFEGGDVFIGSAGDIIQYPESLYEFAFLLNSYLTDNGTRDKTRITLALPGEQLSPDPVVSRQIEQMLRENDIQYHPGVTIKSVNPLNREVSDTNGTTYNYSLLVLAPPHRGQTCMRDSNITDERGYVIVDPADLSVKGNRDVFAIGDANNLSKSKSASEAHGQASFVSSQIISRTIGGLVEDKIVQRLPEFSLTSKNTAFSFFDSPGRIPREINVNKGDFVLRWTSADTYFSSILRGMV